MKNNYKVIKRSGEVVNYDIQKVRRMVEWAVKGFDLNPLKLESNLAINFKAKMMFF